MIPGSLVVIYLAVQGVEMDDGREILNESHSRQARGRIRGYMLSLRRHGHQTAYHRLILFDARNQISIYLCTGFHDMDIG
jgi:hypothetical protein